MFRNTQYLPIHPANYIFCYMIYWLGWFVQQGFTLFLYVSLQFLWSYRAAELCSNTNIYILFYSENMFQTFGPYFIWRYNIGSKTYISLELVSGHPEELNSSCSKILFFTQVVL